MENESRPDHGGKFQYNGQPEATPHRPFEEHTELVELLDFLAEIGVPDSHSLVSRVHEFSRQLLRPEGREPVAREIGITARGTSPADINVSIHILWGSAINIGAKKQSRLIDEVCDAFSENLGRLYPGLNLDFVSPDELGDLPFRKALEHITIDEDSRSFGVLTATP